MLSLFPIIFPVCGTKHIIYLLCYLTFVGHLVRKAKRINYRLKGRRIGKSPSLSLNLTFQFFVSMGISPVCFTAAESNIKITNE